jgi:hypothetical protein
MKRILLPLLLLLACTPRPVRPFSHSDEQTKELNQCDYLYSQCLGRPSSLAPTDGQPNPLDWRGEPQPDCNRRLTRCYENASRREPRP